MKKSRQLVIEKAAETIRNECHVTGFGFQNIFEAAEKVGFRIIRYPIGIDSFLGFAMIKENEKIIFTNSSQILSREIFSIAHEIGHHKLHLSEDGVQMIRDDDFVNRDDDEVEANYFAACLLMPQENVTKFIRLELKDKEVELWNGLDVARIQNTFNVSYDMTLIRLKDLGFLDEIALKYLQKEKVQKSATRLLTAIHGNLELCKPALAKKVPAEYLEWVISNYHDKLIPLKSLETALSFLDLSAEDFESQPENHTEEESLDDLLRGID